MIKQARATLAAAALLLAGPASATTPRDALVMAWNLDALITFDPAQIGEVNGNDIVANVCDTLVDFDPTDVSKVVPKMATWSMSPDGLTLTFKLRPDLTFPSGRRATAEDAAWSMQRFVLLGYGNSANLTQWGFTKDKIAEQIKATDDSTVTVTLAKAYPVGLILSAAFASNDAAMILDKQVGEQNAKMVDGVSDYGNAYFKTNPVCVGPYHVTRWDANDVVVLERNDKYWGPAPHMKRVIVRHVPESGAERLLLEKGDIDVARLLKTEDLSELAKNKDVRIVQTEAHGFTYLALNVTDPILANPKVREAFRYLVDYDGLGRSIPAIPGHSARLAGAGRRVRGAGPQGGAAFLARPGKGQAAAHRGRLSRWVQHEDDPFGQRYQPDHRPACGLQRGQGRHQARAGADGRCAAVYPRSRPSVPDPACRLGRRLSRCRQHDLPPCRGPRCAAGGETCAVSELAHRLAGSRHQRKGRGGADGAGPGQAHRDVSRDPGVHDAQWADGLPVPDHPADRHARLDQGFRYFTVQVRYGTAVK